MRALERVKKLKKERMQKGMDSQQNLPSHEPNEGQQSHGDDEDQ